MTLADKPYRPLHARGGRTRAQSQPTRGPERQTIFMSDRTNTIFGWILFSGIVAMMLNFLTGLVIPDTHRPENLGYVIEGVETEGGEEGPALATLLAQGDPQAGMAAFAKCAACHTIEQGGANGIGPNLFGVMGAPIAGHAPGFDYSSALKEVGGQWTYEAMDEWLASPRGFANGTKMSFAGLSNPEERANVLLYLREMGGGPALPEPPAAADPAADVEAVQDAGDAGVVASDAMGQANPEVADQTGAVGNAAQE